MPLAMQIPRFPPVPSSSFNASDGVTIVIDAGSIDTTIQLSYEPLPIGAVDPPGSGLELRKVFEIGTFDHRANRVSLTLQRPWVLEVPASGLTESFEDPSRLLLARYDKDEGWVPLVTSYYRDPGILQARILKVGRFAVMSEYGVTSSRLTRQASPSA